MPWYSRNKKPKSSPSSSYSDINLNQALSIDAATQAELSTFLKDLDKELKEFTKLLDALKKKANNELKKELKKSKFPISVNFDLLFDGAKEQCKQARKGLEAAQKLLKKKQPISLDSNKELRMFKQVFNNFSTAMSSFINNPDSDDFVPQLMTALSSMVKQNSNSNATLGSLFPSNPSQYTGYTGFSTPSIHVGLASSSSSSSISSSSYRSNLAPRQQQYQTIISYPAKNGYEPVPGDIFTNKTEDQALQAFERIYNALRDGQSGLFKWNFFWILNIFGGTAKDKLNRIMEHANESGSSRTAEAWRIAQKYDFDLASIEQIREIYKYAFEKSRAFKMSCITGTTFFNSEIVNQHLHEITLEKVRASGQNTRSGMIYRDLKI